MDLGAGGGAVTIDCHNTSQLAAFDPTDNRLAALGPGRSCAHRRGTSKAATLRLNHAQSLRKVYMLHVGPTCYVP